MNKDNDEVSLLRHATLIVWDEAPMLYIECFQVVNRLLQDIMGNDLPFGGNLVIIGGDF
jgi:hypothetical protein